MVEGEIVNIRFCSRLSAAQRERPVDFRRLSTDGLGPPFSIVLIGFLETVLSFCRIPVPVVSRIRRCGTCDFRLPIAGGELNIIMILPGLENFLPERLFIFVAMHIS